MEDYVEETKNVIKDLTYDLMTKRGLFIKKLDVSWKTENISDGTSIVTKLVPKVNIVFD